jgi:hypothetical protein
VIYRVVVPLALVWAACASESTRSPTPVAPHASRPPATQPVSNTAPPSPAPARPIGALVSISQGAISIEGSPVGLTSAIDESRQLQRIENLFNILMQKRAASGLAVGAREPASLRVDAVTSGLAFASTYWTMVFAGVDPIHLEVDGAYYRTER